MVTRSDFARNMAGETLSHVQRAIAFLYYYRETQEFDERTASDLANDLRDEGFPKPNVTRLHKGLSASRHTTRGRRPGSFQVDLRQLGDLETKYGHLTGVKKIDVPGSVVPSEWVASTRVYLERLVYQINGSYEYGFYDACGALCRRLMESLIIEVYIREKRHHEIQKDGVFISLDQLIQYVTNDSQVTLGRNTSRSMRAIKQLGDTAAHDRTYVTPQVDVDDLKPRIRQVIQELLQKAGII